MKTSTLQDDTITGNFTPEEKKIVALAQPIGTWLLSAMGAFTEALHTGGYAAMQDFPPKLNDEVTALAIGLWCDAAPIMRPLPAKPRAPAHSPSWNSFDPGSGNRPQRTNLFPSVRRSPPPKAFPAGKTSKKHQ